MFQAGRWRGIGLGLGVVLVFVALWLTWSRAGGDAGLAQPLVRGAQALPPRAAAAPEELEPLPEARPAEAAPRLGLADVPPEPTPEVDAAPAGWHITGRVLDQGGRGVMGARVDGALLEGKNPALVSRATRSDGRGAYDLFLPAPEPGAPNVSGTLRLDLRATADGHEPGRVTQPAGEPRELRMQLVLGKEPALEVLVIDEKLDAVAVAECWLVRVPYLSPAPAGPGSATDPGGRVRLPIDEPGWHVVVARHSAHGVGASDTVLVHADGTTPGIEVALEPFHSISGVALRPDGTPVAGATVAALAPLALDATAADLRDALRPGPPQILDTTGKAFPVRGGEVRTSERGAFVIRGLEAGLYLLLVGDGNWDAPALAPEAHGPFATGSHARLELQAPRLVVEIRDRHRQPLPDVSVTLESSAGEVHELVTDLEGRATLLVTPGPWKVLAEFLDQRRESGVEVPSAGRDVRTRLILDASRPGSGRGRRR